MQFGLGAVLQYSITPSLRVPGFEDEDEDEDEPLYAITDPQKPFYEWRPLGG